MIGEALMNMFFQGVLTALSGLEIIGLPLQYINTLETILVYGIWIVGADIMALFTAMIVGWWGIKFVVGLVLWIWELIPLT